MQCQLSGIDVRRQGFQGGRFRLQIVVGEIMRIVKELQNLNQMK
jgi:hypothetical protein